MDWATLLLQVIPHWVGGVVNGYADLVVTATPLFGKVVFPIFIPLSSFFLIIMMEEMDRT